VHRLSAVRVYLYGCPFTEQGVRRRTRGRTITPAPHPSVAWRDHEHRFSEPLPALQTGACERVCPTSAIARDGGLDLVLLDVHEYIATKEVVSEAA